MVTVMERGVHIALQPRIVQFLPNLHSILPHVAQPVVSDVYEPIAINAMHLVISSQCSLKCDEHHFK